jgi:hypothetical protein
MVKYKWRVGRLVEFFPNNPGLLGMNVNAGEKILVRLRPHHRSDPSKDVLFTTKCHVRALRQTWVHRIVGI